MLRFRTSNSVDKSATSRTQSDHAVVYNWVEGFSEDKNLAPVVHRLVGRFIYGLTSQNEICPRKARGC